MHRTMKVDANNASISYSFASKIFSLCIDKDRLYHRSCHINRYLTVFSPNEFLKSGHEHSSVAQNQLCTESLSWLIAINLLWLFIEKPADAKLHSKVIQNKSI